MKALGSTHTIAIALGYLSCVLAISSMTACESAQIGDVSNPTATTDFGDAIVTSSFTDDGMIETVVVAYDTGETLCTSFYDPNTIESDSELLPSSNMLGYYNCEQRSSSQAIECETWQSSDWQCATCSGTYFNGWDYTVIYCENASNYDACVWWQDNEGGHHQACEGGQLDA